MRYCEHNPNLDYVLGLAKNSRLNKAIDTEMAEAQKLHQATQKPARVFKDFHYRTRKSWSYERRVVGKAEYLAKGENPRFIVTSIQSEQIDARALYEDFDVPVGRWKTGSKNNNWVCSPIGLRPPGCVPTN